MQNWYITPDIVKVKVLEDYKLYLMFKTGEEKIFDMSELIRNHKMYSKLSNKEYFEKVKVRKDTIEWDNGEDVAPEELYHNSIPINKV